MYRVMLVDDEPFIVEGLQDAIDWSAFDLEIAAVAGSGKAALEQLKRQPVDLLVTDITMPGMSGLELIREARGILPGLKAIILSGYNEFDYLKEGMTLGIENYLLKPVNFKELRATLAATAAKLDAEEEPPELALSEEELGILKDRILYRWMRGEIDPSELAQRAELLGLRLDRPWLTSAVVRGTGESISALRKRVRSLLPADARSLSFADLDGDLVLLFPSDTAEAGRASARSAMEILSAAGGLRLSLGTAERIGELEQRSYALAKKAQDYHLLHEGSPILDAADLREQPGSGEALEIGSGDYSRMLLARDTDGLYGRIDEDFRRFQRIEGATPELLQSAAIELVVAFRLELRDMRGGEQAQEVLFRFKKTLDRIGKASSLEELTDAVKAYAHFTMEQLQRSDRVPVVNQVIQYIAGHYREALSLKTLGAAHRIHPAYLGQLFSKETGSGFSEYLNKYRIEKAKELLKDTDDKVADISREVGYVETGYFYKQFKKYVGISPNEYRELRP
ncbi:MULTISPECIES: response regulator transcription factor [Paenibacillus]|nr:MULTISPECIES: response regulator transcription factor [Paenibacillus]KKC48727.1 hypothetical protein VE23_19195 [Paenibacillus sp. D9]